MMCLVEGVYLSRKELYNFSTFPETRTPDEAKMDCFTVSGVGVRKLFPLNEFGYLSQKGQH